MPFLSYFRTTFIFSSPTESTLSLMPASLYVKYHPEESTQKSTNSFYNFKLYSNELIDNVNQDSNMPVIKGISEREDYNCVHAKENANAQKIKLNKRTFLNNFTL